MKTINIKYLKKRCRFKSRVVVGRWVLKTCGMCYGCRTGSPCSRPFFAWFPF